LIANIRRRNLKARLKTFKTGKLAGRTWLNTKRNFEYQFDGEEKEALPGIPFQLKKVKNREWANGFGGRWSRLG